jgi:hypothetical protein
LNDNEFPTAASSSPGLRQNIAKSPNESCCEHPKMRWHPKLSWVGTIPRKRRWAKAAFDQLSNLTKVNRYRRGQPNATSIWRYLFFFRIESKSSWFFQRLNYTNKNQAIVLLTRLFLREKKEL